MSSKRHLFSFNATDLIQEPRTKLCITEYMPIALIALERTRVLAALGRSCGEGNGTPLQYSCLENPWMEEPGRLQSMGSWRGWHDWATSLSLFTFIHWRRKQQPSPVFLPGESQGQRGLVGCHPWGRTESDTTEVTEQQQAGVESKTKLYISYITVTLEY